MSVSDREMDTSPAERATTGGHDRRLVVAALVFIGMAAAFAVGYHSSLSWLVSKWTNDSGTVGHGYLVAAIAVFFAAREFPAFSRRAGSPNLWLVAACAALSLMWLFGHATSVSAVETFVLPAILWTAVGGAFGFAAARVMAFPILVFYTAMPAWDVLRGLFQAISTEAVSVLVSMTSIPAVVEGNLIQLAVGNFEVAGGCAGLNYMLAGATLAVVYSKLTYQRLATGLLFTAIMLALTMVGNWLRIFLILLIAHGSDMQSSLVEDHLGLGWVVFGCMLIPAFLVGEYLQRRESAVAADAGTAARSQATVVKPSIVAAVIVAAGIGPAWAAFSVAQAIPVSTATLQLESAVPGWSGPFPATASWRPEFPAASLEAHGTYRAVLDEVTVYANFYPSQSQGRELISYDNAVGGGLNEMDTKQSSAKADALGFEQRVFLSRDGAVVAWYRYEIGDQFVTGGRQAKLAQLRGQLSGKPGAGVLVLSSPCSMSCDGAIDTLEEFTRASSEKLRLSSLIRSRP